MVRSARERKNQIRSSQGIRRRARAIPSSLITKDVAGRAARAHKNPIRLSQGGMRHAWAIPDSPIPRVSRGARAQKPDLRSQGSQAACTSNTRFAQNKDVARCAVRARHN